VDVEGWEPKEVPPAGRSGRAQALEAQQVERVRMSLSGQQLPGRLAYPLGAAAAREHAMAQQQLQHAQVGVAQVAVMSPIVRRHCQTGALAIRGVAGPS